ncbi:uncharacterized protein PG998_009914 [Apiospora kogelbergensis]|uniref:F-box domain-containing protein n=1 Tax=Apiospora kogelbergensis TaxID=1337665 RepID=A0AAW0R999_9PEZI
MTNGTVQHRVLLRIPELLEAIILHLDQKAILVNAQRVCHQWHRCITEMPSIQHHLFLLPEPTSNDNHDSKDGASSNPPRPNPLLARHFPEWFEHCTTWPPDQRLPFVRTTDPSARGMNDDRLFPTMPWVHRRLDAYVRPDATWRRMLLQQPPRRGLGLVMTHCGRLVRGDLPEHTKFGDIGDGGWPANLDRPATLPELLELTCMCIHVRPVVRVRPADGDDDDQQQQSPQERHAVARFRVMWGRLSPDESASPSGSVAGDELQSRLQSAMDKHGIVVQHDSCPHTPAEPDVWVHRLGPLWLNPS